MERKDPFSVLLGLSGVNPAALGNITTHVLHSLDEVFEGGVEVAETDESLGGEDFRADNETLPIFQDIHIILDDSGNGSAVATFSVNGTEVSVDLSNPAIVYDTSEQEIFTLTAPVL